MMGLIHFLALPLVFAARHLQNDASGYMMVVRHDGSDSAADFNFSGLENGSNGSQLENDEPLPPRPPRPRGRRQKRPKLKGPLLTLNGKTDLKFQFRYEWSSIPVTGWHDLIINGYVSSIVDLLQERPELPLTCPQDFVGHQVYLILREKLKFTEILHSKVFTAISGVAGTSVGGGAKSALQGVLTKLLPAFKMNVAAAASTAHTAHRSGQLVALQGKIGRMLSKGISKDGAMALLSSFVTYGLVYEEETGTPWSLEGKGNAFDWILSQVHTMTRLYHWLSWTDKSVRLTLKNTYGGFQYGEKYYYDLKMKCVKSPPGSEFKAFVAFENEDGLIERVTAKHLAVYVLVLS